MRLTRIAALVSALVVSATAQCDDEYECEYRSTDGTRSFYDLKNLCDPNNPYQYTPPGSDSLFVFQVCGTVNVDCLPYGYQVEYKRGTAIQFFGGAPPAGPVCFDKVTSTYQNCTRDCEILGVGAPIFSLADPTKPKGGVNVTHTGIPSLPSDHGACPGIDPSTGASPARTLTISVQCDPTAATAVIVSAREYSTCKYEVIMRSSAGCGCTPSCYGRNCDDDGCGGFCGGAGRMGLCPPGNVCNDGQCCVPACSNRQCGDDGCGSTCGSCGPSAVCTKYGVCAAIASPSATPAAAPPVMYYSTTNGGDSAAAFLGGVTTVAFVTLGFSYFTRVRAAFTGYTRA